jgi:hypothetical protein
MVHLLDLLLDLAQGASQLCLFILHQCCSNTLIASHAVYASSSDKLSQQQQQKQNDSAVQLQALDTVRVQLIVSIPFDTVRVQLIVSIPFDTVP